MIWFISGTLPAQQLIESVSLGALSKEKLVDSFGIFIRNGVQLEKLQEQFSGMFPVTASTPMSGAYDLSGATKAAILDDNEYLFPSFVFNVLLSYNMIYDLYGDLSQLFKEPYDSLAVELFAERIELGDLNEMVKIQLEIDFGGVFPKKMLQDSVLNNLINNPTHPLNRVLEENDVYDWAPAAPTRLLYCMTEKLLIQR